MYFSGCSGIHLLDPKGGANVSLLWLERHENVCYIQKYLQTENHQETQFYKSAF